MIGIDALFDLLPANTSGTPCSGSVGFVQLSRKMEKNNLIKLTGVTFYSKYYLTLFRLLKNCTEKRT